MNCIVIHGCPSNVEKAMDPATRTYDKHWIPWIKERLMERGINTDTPLMPNPWAPDYTAFKQEFEKYPVGEETILIGHSCGTRFLVRWLNETKQHVKKLIMVAPWIDGRGTDGIKKAFYDFALDDSLPSQIGEIVVFTADDEEEDGKRATRIYKEKFPRIKVIELHGRGHYTMEDMGTVEFPELLEEVLR
jgi:predicted alpha/beta hydrolase family esterase